MGDGERCVTPARAAAKETRSACTIYKIRSRLPRESVGRQNHGNMQMINTFSVWKFRLGILDYLLRNPVFSGNFPFGNYHLHSNRNFRIFVVNDKQPLLISANQKLACTNRSGII